MAAVPVVLGTITFGDGVPDADGAFWRLAAIDGWDSPEVRQQFHEPTGRHGLRLGSSLYGPRALLLAGSCVVPSDAAFWLAFNRLAAVTAFPATPTLAVYETTPKSCAVVRSDRIRMKPFGPLNGFEFEVPLIAVDPRKYALSNTSTALPGTGGTTATNTGTVETWPTLTVEGPGSGNVIVSNVTTGRTVRFDVTLGAGETLVADFRNATLTVDGIQRQELVHSVTSWWPLVAGSNVITNSGGGTRTLVHRAAWI